MRKIGLLVVVLAALVAVWWIAAAPRPEIRCCVEGSISIDPATGTSHAGRRSLRGLRGEPGIVPLGPARLRRRGLRRQRSDGAGHRARRAGLDLDVGHPVGEAARRRPADGVGHPRGARQSRRRLLLRFRILWDRPPGELAGLYRLNVETPARSNRWRNGFPTRATRTASPIVYADGDRAAPELKRDGSGAPSRPIAVCDNLEVSEDGRRIYFSEPFAYENASVDDAIDEAIALAGNGRLCRYDLDSGTTRLIADGLPLHQRRALRPAPGGRAGSLVIVTQTSLFRVTRFFLSGPKAGSAEVVIDGLPGTPDGMDRDGAGRIWLAMFLERSDLLTLGPRACLDQAAADATARRASCCRSRSARGSSS